MTTLVRALMPWLILLTLAGRLQGQTSLSDRYLEVIGTSELDMEPLGRATATLYEDGRVVKKIQTGPDGSFSFRLEMNKQYVIEISKEQLMSKRISFNTTIPDEQKGTWVSEFSMGLVRYCEGVDYSVLDEPVDRVSFDVRQQKFVSDRNYVNAMRPRIENVLISYEECMMDKYEAALLKGDQLASRKDYQAAKLAYEEALAVYPTESYPQKRLSELENAMNRDRATTESYSKFIADGDALMAKQSYTEALTAYKSAMALKPGDETAAQKISGVQSLLAAQQAEKMAQRDIDDRYNQAVAKAAQAYGRKDYGTALQYYGEAADIKPAEATPAAKIKEINGIIAGQLAEQEKQKATDEAYKAALASADLLMGQKKYDEAREQYKVALQIKPLETLPKQKIAEADRMKEADARAAENARLAEAEKAYQAVVSRGDSLFKARNYDGATAAYRQAITMKPEDAYARQKIAAIDNTIKAEQAAVLKKQEDAYADAMKAGEAALVQKQYAKAAEAFVRAAELKPGDAAADARLTETRRQETEQQKLAEERRQQQMLLQSLVDRGDELLSLNDLEGAREQYSQALRIKADEGRALSGIRKIEDRLAMTRAEQQKAADEAYGRAMSLGKAALAEGQHQQAIDAYRQALDIRPGDAGAQLKLNEVEALVRQEQQRAAEEQLIREKYGKAIEEGDRLKEEKKYEEALTAYSEALGLMPAAEYPRQRMEEINSMLEEGQRLASQERARENAYAMALEAADKYFRARNYEGARAEYMRALAIKPGEALPQKMLAEADQLVQEQAAARLMAQETADRYAETMNRADSLYSLGRYEESVGAYGEALRYKPEDQLAAEKIRKTRDLMATLEKKQQSEQQLAREYEEAIAQADREFDAGNYAVSRQTYTRALNLQPGSAYARQRIARIDEINRILARSGKGTTAAASSAAAGQSASLRDLDFRNESELQLYLDQLKGKYPPGVTLEVYREKYREIFRYIVIRNDQVQEFRQVRFLTFGGESYQVNGKPITQLYFNSQVRPREGETFRETVMQ